MELIDILKPFLDREFNQAAIEVALVGYFQDRLIAVNYLISKNRRLLGIDIEAYQVGTAQYNGLYSYNSTITYG